MTAPKSRFLIGSRMLEATPWQTHHEMIAYLLSGNKVVCPKCAFNYDLVEQRSNGLYPIHFGLYQQSCHDCGTILATGLCESQLYPKPAPDLKVFLQILSIGKSRRWFEELLESQKEALLHNDEKKQRLIRANIENIEAELDRKRSIGGVR